MIGQNNTQVFENLYANAKKPGDLPWDNDEPATFLSDIVENSAPGRALDLGCGSGVDSVYLASNGWDVLALDFMPQAINMTRHRAAGAGVRIDVQRADISIWSGAGRFDLIIDAGCLHALRSAYRKTYKEKLLDWLTDDSQYLLRHAECRNLLEWRPMGPKRVPRKSILKLFEPQFIEEDFDRHVFSGVKLPYGPSFAHTTYWFKRAQQLSE
jgi:cyclopropane fatty-acyl-phospholipid synthase-like methyltransferase